MFHFCRLSTSMSPCELVNTLYWTPTECCMKCHTVLTMIRRTQVPWTITLHGPLFTCPFSSHHFIQLYLTSRHSEDIGRRKDVCSDGCWYAGGHAASLPCRQKPQSWGLWGARCSLVTVHAEVMLPTAPHCLHALLSKSKIPLQLW